MAKRPKISTRGKQPTKELLNIADSVLKEDKKETFTRLNIRIPDTLHDSLLSESKKTGLSKTALIILALRDKLNIE